MKNPNILIALVIIFILILGIKYDYYDSKEQEEHPAVNEISTVPDDMMRNATHYYLDLAQRRTSIEYIKKAISSMRLIEKDMNEAGDELIEIAIADLENLLIEFEKREVDVDHMRHAFANSLNSLALAQLRLSESYMEQGREDEAAAATKYALSHISNAMYFSYDAELEAEKHILSMVDKLKNQEDLSEAEVRAKIHEAIIELDQVLAVASRETGSSAE